MTRTGRPLWMISDAYATWTVEQLTDAITTLQGIVRKEGADRSSYRFELAELKRVRTARWSR